MRAASGRLNMIGFRTGHLAVVDRADKPKTTKKNSKDWWLTKCLCGRRAVVSGYDLLTNNRKWCGVYDPIHYGKQYVMSPGTKFGHWTVLGNGDKDKKWLCECVCGERRSVQRSELIRNKTKSCGCVSRESSLISRKSKNSLMIGRKFGRLTVVRMIPKSEIPPKETANMWDCVCDCGGTRKVRSTRLRKGIILACAVCVKNQRG